MYEEGLHKFKRKRKFIFHCSFFFWFNFHLILPNLTLSHTHLWHLGGFIAYCVKIHWWWWWSTFIIFRHLSSSSSFSSKNIETMILFLLVDCCFYTFGHHHPCVYNYKVSSQPADQKMFSEEEKKRHWNFCCRRLPMNVFFT